MMAEYRINLHRTCSAAQSEVKQKSYRRSSTGCLDKGELSSSWQCKTDDVEQSIGDGWGAYGQDKQYLSQSDHGVNMTYDPWNDAPSAVGLLAPVQHEESKEQHQNGRNPTTSSVPHKKSDSFHESLAKIDAGIEVLCLARDSLTDNGPKHPSWKKTSSHSLPARSSNEDSCLSGVARLSAKGIDIIPNNPTKDKYDKHSELYRLLSIAETPPTPQGRPQADALTIIPISNNSNRSRSNSFHRGNSSSNLLDTSLTSLSRQGGRVDEDEMVANNENRLASSQSQLHKGKGKDVSGNGLTVNEAYMTSRIGSFPTNQRKNTPTFHVQRKSGPEGLQSNSTSFTSHSGHFLHAVKENGSGNKGRTVPSSPDDIINSDDSHNNNHGSLGHNSNDNKTGDAAITTAMPPCASTMVLPPPPALERPSHIPPPPPPPPRPGRSSGNNGNGLSGPTSSKLSNSKRSRVRDASPALHASLTSSASSGEGNALIDNVLERGYDIVAEHNQRLASSINGIGHVPPPPPTRSASDPNAAVGEVSPDTVIRNKPNFKPSDTAAVNSSGGHAKRALKRRPQGNSGNSNGGGINKRASGDNVSQVMDVIASMTPSTPAMADDNTEADPEFKRFCSLSLNEFEPPPFDEGVGDNTANGKSKLSSSLGNHEFNSSSISANFTPRPVRVTQFTDDSPAVDCPSPRGTRSVTTREFMSSMQKLPLSANNNEGSDAHRDTPVESSGGWASVSHYKNSNSAYKAPPSVQLSVQSSVGMSSSKLPTSSSTVMVENLPSHVDKKGRCTRHPNIKLYKKKLLGKGYEQVRETCPTCVEEAPYEELWRGRAKNRRQRPGGNTSCDQQNELSPQNGEHELPMNDSNSSKNERSYGNMFGSTQTRRSRSRESRRRRSKSSERRGSDESDRSGGGMPYVPSLQAGEQQGGIQRSPHHAKATSSGIMAHLPPQPLHQENSKASRRPSPPPRRGRPRPTAEGKVTGAMDRMCSRSMDKVRSISVGRSKPKLSTSFHSEAETEKSLNSEAKNSSILDRGRSKISSLQNRARSSSRKRSSAHETQSLASSHHSFGHRSRSPARHKSPGKSSGISSEQPSRPGIVSADDFTPNHIKKNVLSVSKSTRNLSVSKTSGFDKKTGRCKTHPSVIMAKKSKFQKGWDVVRDSCPLCDKDSEKAKKNNASGDGDNSSGEEFCEISKKKMSQLLRGTNGGSANLNGVPSFETNNNVCSPAEAVDNPPSNAMIGISTRALADGDNTSNKREETSEKSGSGSSTKNLPRVSRMPYTTPWGESGWYTGTVNENGKPHGKGRMRFKTGNTTEGKWEHGYSEEFLERKGRMKSGFGTNVAAWKDDRRYERSLSKQRDRSRERPLTNSSGSGGQGVDNNMATSSSQYLQAQQQQGYQQYPQASPGGYQQYPSNYGMATASPYGGASAGMWNQQAAAMQGGGYYPAYSPSGNRRMHPMSMGYQQQQHHSSGYHQS